MQPLKPVGGASKPVGGDVACSRREIVHDTLKTAAFVAITTLAPSEPAFATDTSAIPAIRSAIGDIIAADPSKGPTLVRLAWHSSGTYSKLARDGGSSPGTIRFKEELLHGGNAGLAKTAVPWLEKVKKKFGDKISYADLYTLAGVVAIEKLGGPTIGWRAGRRDGGEDMITPDGRLPNADSGPPGSDPSDGDHLRSIFYRMGFDDRAIVALSGAHALGRCHTTASGYEGPWSPTPTVFNNAYFVLLKDVEWNKRDWNGPFQYENGKGGSLMMLPTDIVLIQDPKFKKWVNAYAKDQKLFFDDFAKYFQQLEELGCGDLVSA